MLEVFGENIAAKLARLVYSEGEAFFIRPGYQLVGGGIAYQLVQLVEERRGLSLARRRDHL